MSTVVHIWRGLRPKHWIKNLFVFAGILFSQNISQLSMLLVVACAFFVFCLLSSSAYLINDIRDLEQDKHHPLKRHRPLASGKLNVRHAILVLGFLVPFSLGMAYLLGASFFLVACVYLLLQLAYSFALKRIVIVDSFAVAFGFMLRVVAGAVVINVEVSSWLLICTILIALFLALTKRRRELVILEQDAQHHRKVLGEYTPYLLDQLIAVVTPAVLLAYTLYTMAEETAAKFGTNELVLTVPFVLYGVLRYVYLVHGKETSAGPETVLLTDVPLLIDIVLWAAAVGVILYR